MAHYRPRSAKVCIEIGKWVVKSCEMHFDSLIVPNAAAKIIPHSNLVIYGVGKNRNKSTLSQNRSNSKTCVVRLCVIQRLLASVDSHSG